MTEPLIINWRVTPLEAGKSQVLVMQLFVIFGKPGNFSPPVLLKTFEANISVDVDVWNQVWTFMGSTTNVIGIFSWGVAHLMMLILYWRWERPRRRQTPPAG